MQELNFYFESNKCIFMVKQKGEFEIVTSGEKELPKGVMDGATILNRTFFIELIKNIVNNNKGIKSINFILPIESAFVRKISVPSSVQNSDLLPYIRSKSVDKLHLTFKKVNLDFTTVSSTVQRTFYSVKLVDQDLLDSLTDIAKKCKFKTYEFHTFEECTTSYIRQADYYKEDVVKPIMYFCLHKTFFQILVVENERCNYVLTDELDSSNPSLEISDYIIRISNYYNKNFTDDKIEKAYIVNFTTNKINEQFISKLDDLVSSIEVHELDDLAISNKLRANLSEQKLKIVTAASF